MLYSEEKSTKAPGMKDWQAVCEEFKNHEWQATNKEEFSAMYSAYNKVHVAIMDANSQEQLLGHEVPLKLANADIIRPLRFLTTKLRIAEISHDFPRLMEFYQQAEAGCLIKNNFFEESLPGDVHNKIFGQVSADEEYSPGYINLQEEKETKRSLSETNNNGYRIFHEPRVNKLLYAIVTGDQDKAERMIKKRPEILLEEGCVTDYSNQTFSKVKAFAIAKWLGDVKYGCPMILDCLPQNEEGERIRQDLVEQEKTLREKGLTYRLKNGELKTNQKPFDYSELINALQEYVDNYDNWSPDKREAHWCKVVGHAQRNLPVHVVAHYCDPEVPFYPTPEFNKDRRPQCLDFYNYLTGKTEFWFAPVSDSDGLGVGFGIVRGLRGARAVLGGLGQVGDELCAIKALCKERKSDEALLMQRLQTPIQKPEVSQDRETCTIS